jgi:SAM-dependent methyltransferase
VIMTVKRQIISANGDGPRIESECSLSSLYDEQFFNSIEAGSLEAARVIVPILLGFMRPTSVVDFGCGRATWLKAFQENGVAEVLGLDGPYVDSNKLLINSRDFISVDLVKPVRLGHRFDLAVCLEVAEHLPAKGARNLVGSLAAAAPVVMFSAAIPGQAGTNHVNEQWPKYWEDMFSKLDYRRLDAIRPLIWFDTRIAWWYRQNIYLFATESSLSELRERGACATPTFDPELEIVARQVLDRYTSYLSLLKETILAAPRMLRNHIHRRRT